MRTISTHPVALLAGAAVLGACSGDPSPGRRCACSRRRPACRPSPRSASSCSATSPCRFPAACPARPAISRNSRTRRRPATSCRRAGPAWTCPGIRNSPSIRYASFTPPFGFDEEGTAFGGLFRDGRVPTLVEQAKQPFLDAREMANATPAERDRAPCALAECGALPCRVRRGGARRPGCGLRSLAAAIAQYQVENCRTSTASTASTTPSSPARRSLSPAEERGLALFEDPEKGNCAACHPSRPAADGSPPLFTDFTYDNVGLPRNAHIPANADPALLRPRPLRPRAQGSRRAPRPLRRLQGADAPERGAHRAVLSQWRLRHAARGGRFLRAPRHRPGPLVPEGRLGRAEVRRPARRSLPAP